MNQPHCLSLLICFLSFSGFPLWATDHDRQPLKKLLIIAGKPSHKVGEHEYNAGALLIRQWFTNSPDVAVTVCLNGWPTDSTEWESSCPSTRMGKLVAPGAPEFCTICTPAVRPCSSATDEATG